MAKPKKILRGVGIGFLVLVVLILVVLGWFTLREYRPDPVETVETPSGEKKLSLEDSFCVVTYNTGYSGLDASKDFFMDGGTQVQPDTKEQVLNNSKGIQKILSDA